jgi:hypothetical protein
MANQTIPYGYIHKSRWLVDINDMHISICSTAQLRRSYGQGRPPPRVSGDTVVLARTGGANYRQTQAHAHRFRWPSDDVSETLPVLPSEPSPTYVVAPP